MAHSAVVQVNPELDLVLERVVDVPPEKMWTAWTVPEHLMKWFTPAPWKTVDCEIDLRPGGIFRTVMRSPEGEDFPESGCYLQVVKNEILAWTSALQAGYRPKEPKPPTGGCDDLIMTAILRFEPHPRGTRFTATVLHADTASRRRHEEMGFRDGWGKALDQLVAAARDF